MQRPKPSTSLHSSGHARFRSTPGAHPFETASEPFLLRDALWSLPRNLAPCPREPGCARVWRHHSKERCGGMAAPSPALSSTPFHNRINRDHPLCQRSSSHRPAHSTRPGLLLNRYRWGTSHDFRLSLRTDTTALPPTLTRDIMRNPRARSSEGRRLPREVVGQDRFARHGASPVWVALGRQVAKARAGLAM
jgi:hypothetical protein